MRSFRLIILLVSLLVWSLEHQLNEDWMRELDEAEKERHLTSDQDSRKKMKRPKRQKSMCKESHYDFRVQQLDQDQHLRMLATATPHRFVIKPVPNMAIPNGQNEAMWLTLFNIAAKYWQRVLQVTNLATSTVPTSTVCSFGNIPEPYASNGIDQSQMDMVVLLNWINLPAQSFLAFAAPCIKIKWVVYGQIQYNLAYTNIDVTQQAYHILVELNIHQMAHLLGLSRPLFSKFYSSYDNNTYRPESQVISTHSRAPNSSFIILAPVKEYVQSYFNCTTDSSVGAMLQNNGDSQSAGSHWEYQNYYDDMLSPFSWTSSARMGPLTLHFLKGTGMYFDVDTNISEPALFLKNRGCDAALGLITPTPEFCSTYNAVGCSYYYSFVGACLSENQFSSRKQLYTNVLGPAWTCTWAEHRERALPSAIFDVQNSKCLNTYVSFSTGPAYYGGCYTSTCYANGSIIFKTQYGTSYECRTGGPTSFRVDGFTYVFCPNYQRFCWRKNCQYACRQGGFCLAGECLMATCNITNCDFCNTDYGKTGNKTWCQTCSSGYVPDFSQNQTVCIQCSAAVPHCLTCGEKNDVIKCYSCNVGYFPKIDFSACVDCAAAITQCTLCTFADGRTQCSSCSPSTYPNALNSVCSATCGGAISKCTACYQDGGVTLCSACQTLLYPSLTKLTCQPCSTFISQCLTCTEQAGIVTKCNSCSPGYLLNITTNTSCPSCRSHIANCSSCENDVAPQCKVCDTGLYPNIARTACTVCTSVITACLACSVNAAGVTTCINCGNNLYASNGACKLCSDNCASCTGTNTNCTSCASGKYLSLSKICINIPLPNPGIEGGTCINNNNLNLMCKAGCRLCQCTSANTTYCHQVEERYFLSSNVPVACQAGCKTCTNATNCTVCLPRYILTGGDCNLCDSTCAQCSAESRYCSKCYTGQYLNGQLRCSRCLAQKCLRCNQVGDCSVCQPGYYPSAAASKCQQCPVTCPYCNPNNIALCSGCDDGFYLQNNECKRCLTGCMTCTNSTTCTACDKTYTYSTQNTSICVPKCQLPCFTCEDGIPNKCLSCFAGYILSQVDNSCFGTIQCPAGACAHCPLGHYNTGDACTPCNIANCMQCSQSSGLSCQTCNLGYYLNKTTPVSCIVCPAMCKTCISESVCLICATGYTEQKKLTTSGIEKVTGNCFACESPCATCSGNSQNCQSCIQNYRLQGWKCTSASYTRIILQIERSWMSFVINGQYQNIVNEVRQALGQSIRNNPFLLSIVTIKPGGSTNLQALSIQNSNSTLIIAEISNQTSNAQPLCRTSANLESAFGNNKIGNYSIRAIAFETSTNQIACPQQIGAPSNLGLSLGLGLGLGISFLVTLILVAVFIVIRRNRSGKVTNLHNNSQHQMQAQNSNAKIDEKQNQTKDARECDDNYSVE